MAAFSRESNGKIHESDWRMLLILTESKSIDQSDSRILQQLHRYFLCWTQSFYCDLL